MTRLKCLEIFSGAGGLAKGLELSGFEHLAFVEVNKHACATLSENFDTKKIFCGDIRNFDLDALDSVDLIAGGPPCQPFSLGGKHQANQDSRDMFPYAIQAINKLRPKAFIFENVKGLLRPAFADYFDYIILRLSYPDFVAKPNADWREHLEKLRSTSKLSYAGKKYDVQFKLINAADYGVPQMRERVIIVGTRANLALNWSFPNATHSEDRLLWDMAITGDYWKQHQIAKSSQPAFNALINKKIIRLKQKYCLSEPTLKPWQTVRDALCDVPNPQSNHNRLDHVFRDGARSYVGHTGSAIDWASKTIKAGDHGVPGGENMIRFHDDIVRYFTVLEAKRIQTFPDDFVIKGAWGEAMRQIGNAVPVLLAEKIGTQLAAEIKMCNKAHQIVARRNAHKLIQTSPD
jgi:DNA (cytosine-5)-methyltransferase 1